MDFAYLARAFALPHQKITLMNKYHYKQLYGGLLIDILIVGLSHMPNLTYTQFSASYLPVLS
jgi:hypothetical protein